MIFLRLAELTQGETDVILSAGDWSGYGALNYTLIRYHMLNVLINQRPKNEEKREGRG